MKNTDFYAFCRDNRRSESDLARREALNTVYNFMRECGVTKAGVTQFITVELARRKDPHLVWLLNVFIPQEQEAQQ